MSIVFIVFAALIFAGFQQPFDTTLFAPTWNASKAVLVLVWSTLALIAIIAVLTIVLRQPVSTALIVPIAIAVFLVGLLLTLVSTAFSPPHATLLTLAHGGALSVAVASSVLGLSIGALGCLAQGRHSWAWACQRLQRFGRFCRFRLLPFRPTVFPLGIRFAYRIMGRRHAACDLIEWITPNGLSLLCETFACLRLRFGLTSENFRGAGRVFRFSALLSGVGTDDRLAPVLPYTIE